MTTTVPAPRVSVLMTMFNAAAYLQAAIESLLAQSYRDFELIIVDDGSTDESAAVAESLTDPRLRLVRNPANRGQNACLNQGLALARGEFVARQDADDLSRPDRLEKQARSRSSARTRRRSTEAADRLGAPICRAIRWRSGGEICFSTASSTAP